VRHSREAKSTSSINQTSQLQVLQNCTSGFPAERALISDKLKFFTQTKPKNHQIEQGNSWIQRSIKDKEIIIGTFFHCHKKSILKGLIFSFVLQRQKIDQDKSD